MNVFGLENEIIHLIIKEFFDRVFFFYFSYFLLLLLAFGVVVFGSADFFFLFFALTHVFGVVFVDHETGRVVGDYEDEIHRDKDTSEESETGNRHDFGKTSGKEGSTCGRTRC